MTEKPLLKALNGQVPDRVPFWFMRQAGRYLPEYRALRSERKGFWDMVYNPEVACEITMQPLRRYGMSGAILFSDILVIPHALGQKVEFVPGTGPVLDPVRDAGALDALDPENIDQTLSPIYGSLKNIVQALKDENFNQTTLIGFAGSPWTVASYMAEGSGSKDFKEAKSLAYRDPGLFEAMIERVTEATIRYLSQQIEAGAEALQLFDSWAAMADAEHVERFIIQPTRTIRRRLKQDYPHIPVIGFPKGAGPHLERYARETEIDGIGLDSHTDLQTAAKLQKICCVQGNLDPFALLAGGEEMTRRADNILHALADGPFIFNLGHGIHKETNPDTVQMLVNLIKDYR